MEIPKKAKLSYFLSPQFFYLVLKYLMAINENDMIETFPLDFNKEIRATKKSSLERFLDIISIEFNKHSKVDENYDDDPDHEVYNFGSISKGSGTNSRKPEDRSKTETDSAIFQVEILNFFLSQIDIEILTAWKSDDPCMGDKNYGHQSTRKKIIDEANKLFWGANKDVSQDEEMGKTLRNDPMVYKKKVFQRNDYLLQKKVSSELSDLGILDVIDLINQLYVYMSVILCIGILGKRAAWGITQMNYLDNNSKLALKGWCRNEAKLKEFDLQLDNNEDSANLDIKGNIASTASLNLQSSNLNYILGNAGWMNVSEGIESDIICNGKIFKKFEEFIAKHELIENQNMNLLAANEELKTKLQHLYEAIENLRKEANNEKNEGMKNENGKATDEEIIGSKKGISGSGEIEADNLTVTDEASVGGNYTIDKNSKALTEMREQYEKMIYELKTKLLETENINSDLNQEIKFLEFKNDDLMQDKDLIIAKLDAEKAYLENLHYISCLEDVHEDGKKGVNEKIKDRENTGQESNSTITILLLAKALIEKQNAYQESVDDIKNELLLFSSKYEILKSFTKKIRERNLQYSLAVNEMLENDRRVWEWVMGLKYRVKKVEAQLGKMRDRMDEILIISKVSPGWAREVEILRQSIKVGLENIEGYLWSGKCGTSKKFIDQGRKEGERIVPAENDVIAENGFSREGTIVRPDSEETRIVK